MRFRVLVPRLRPVLPEDIRSLSLGTGTAAPSTLRRREPAGNWRPEPLRPTVFRLGGQLEACIIQRRLAGNWARADAKKPRALVVHPRLPGDKENLLAWDGAEAVALAQALGWKVVNPFQVQDDGDEEAGEAIFSGSDSEEESSDEEEGDVQAYVARIDRVDPRFFFPTAELSRLAVLLAQSQANMLFVNEALSPAQQRHLEAAMDLAGRAQRPNLAANEDDVQQQDGGVSIPVFDRTRVVLAIFARRASSPIAKLSIELAEAQEAKAKLGASAVQGVAAQLQRIADALVRKVPGCDKAMLMARSGGARGVSTSFTSSPQITRQKQQRAIEEKERRIREELSRLRAHRGARRRRRGREIMQTIGLVGYTNVGKSAMVNRLSGADLMVKDGVFVTLDIAARRFLLPSGMECHILDSVGFVKDLPFELCEAFQATVEELQVADLVLHVRDMSHPARDEHWRVVRDVLEKAGIDTERRVLEVWNKTDLLTDKEARHLFYIHQKQDSTPVHMVSAKEGNGFDELLEALERKLEHLAVRTVPGHSSASGAIEAPKRGLQRVRIPSDIPAEEAAERWAFLSQNCTVVQESITAEEKSGATLLEAWMDDTTRARCLKRFGGSMLV